MNRLLLLLSCLIASTLLAQSPQPPKGPDVYTMQHPEVLNQYTSPIWIDANKKQIHLLVEATGVPKGYEAEYLLIGKLSDRAYESFAITWANPSDITQAMTTLGVPIGQHADSTKGLSVARGERFTLSFKHLDGKVLTDWVVLSDPRTQKSFEVGFPWVGGGQTIDMTMPASIVPGYTERISLFGLPYHAEKGQAYGSIRVNQSFEMGTPLIATLTWQQLPSGKPRVCQVPLALTPKTLSAPDELLLQLKQLSQAQQDTFIQVDFADDLTIRQAKGLAQVLIATQKQSDFHFDQPNLGNPFIRAFLPQESWRSRQDRLFQPWEVRIAPAEKGCGYRYTLTHIQEDWSGENIDPRLVAKDYPFTSWQELLTLTQAIHKESFKMDTVLFFVPADLPVGELKRALRVIQQSLPVIWIFTDES